MKITKKTNKKALKDYLRVEYSENKMFGLIVCVGASVGLGIANILFVIF